MKTYKSLIVDRIQKGLYNSYIEKKDLNLKFSNYSWVSNYNFVFHELTKLNGVEGLYVRSFQRHGYKMACIYSSEDKTLFTICSESKFNKLRNRKSIEKYHCTDALCLLSCHNGSVVQMNMLGEEVEIETRENLQLLLKSLITSFENEFDIKEYCILSCRFNHSSCELYSIIANYMNKTYDVIKEDKSWNELLIPNVDLMDLSDGCEESHAVLPETTIKNKFNIKFKNKNENEKIIEN